MIIGIGLDLIEIDRISDLLKRQERFPNRILTLAELEVFESLPSKRQVEFLAGRFAAKEAYAKALGTGIGELLSFQDIEIAKDELGKPFFQKPAGRRTHLSITHTKQYAAAQVVIEE
ncbi:holo-ACP synthase [Neobacillus notoginsengisoli]|uniref:Holo-[acyl-carrier-protein] synthase n=1 Tax=Neobacillus notoginsengisoli TaxID=1578198 RepID=A0A417YMJ2_9BACI|nr:holo-ACP synthase [Neobacillus notoginsengisoli]RHW34869.1 holo-ACP synthase [Neobacillus notoginsengisoli]